MFFQMMNNYHHTLLFLLAKTLTLITSIQVKKHLPYTRNYIYLYLADKPRPGRVLRADGDAPVLNPSIRQVTPSWGAPTTWRREWNVTKRDANQALRKARGPSRHTRAFPHDAPLR